MSGEERKKLAGYVERGEQNGIPLLSQGRKKKFTLQIRQNRWEPVDPLVWISVSQQIKLVDFGVFSHVGSAFPEV